MKVWIVYESLFGNTEAVARAVAEGLGTAGSVTVEEVNDASASRPDVDLLVVGGPTHAFGLSRESTRSDGAQKAGRTLPADTIGLREWLDAMPERETTAGFAAFDTRVRHPRLPGSAAKKAAKRLRQRGWSEAARPESFWVEGTQGPLLDGELERARAWGRALVEGRIDDTASVG